MFNLLMELVVVIYGGVWVILDKLLFVSVEGVCFVVCVGYDVLIWGGSVMDVVEVVVRVMEDCLVFDVGIL